ncbi:hypothetical protein [Novosphingobium sp. Leaf2]|uniref:hypothetical protein n=1 Tax=Novosphingobium sp. Leaf2 TaxID=1735670 RepID=UPI0007147B9A|nr:hypothetical protein [Novosphingobium sp. Leaf2]KQM19674.1 hypothetical protein ASE49_05580 [Novosphingobium sp. Leaf2]
MLKLYSCPLLGLRATGVAAFGERIGINAVRRYQAESALRIAMRPRRRVFGLQHLRQRYRPNVTDLRTKPASASVCERLKAKSGVVN